jgi:hypothetical protein
VIVGVSITGTIKLWTVNANEAKVYHLWDLMTDVKTKWFIKKIVCWNKKGSEIIEHEFRNCQCENANTLASCPGKQRIFIVVCPKFFQVCFDRLLFKKKHTLLIPWLWTRYLTRSTSPCCVRWTYRALSAVKQRLVHPRTHQSNSPTASSSTSRALSCAQATVSPTYSLYPTSKNQLIYIMRINVCNHPRVVFVKLQSATTSLFPRLTPHRQLKHFFPLFLERKFGWEALSD